MDNKIQQSEKTRNDLSELSILLKELKIEQKIMNIRDSSNMLEDLNYVEDTMIGLCGITHIYPELTFTDFTYIFEKDIRTIINAVFNNKKQLEVLEDYLDYKIDDLVSDTLYCAYYYQRYISDHIKDNKDALIWLCGVSESLFRKKMIIAYSKKQESKRIFNNNSKKFISNSSVLIEDKINDKIDKRLLTENNNNQHSITKNAFKCAKFTVNDLIDEFVITRKGRTEIQRMALKNLLIEYVNNYPYNFTNDQVQKHLKILGVTLNNKDKILSRFRKFCKMKIDKNYIMNKTTN